MMKNFILKNKLAIAACVIVLAFGVGYWVLSNPGTSTIGEDITAGGRVCDGFGNCLDTVGGSGSIFGPSVSKTINTVYTADTSGILVVRAYIPARYEHNYVEIRSDDSATPTTAVGHIGANCWDNCNTGIYHTMSVPILKDKKYRVVQSGGGVVVNAIQFYPNN